MILPRDTIKNFNASLVKTCIDHTREITIIFFFFWKYLFSEKVNVFGWNFFFIKSLGAFSVLAEVLELRLLYVVRKD